MNSRYLPIVIVFAAALCACGSKDLTKEQAKALLNEYFDAHPTTQQLLTGTASIGTDSEAEYFAKPGGVYQKALEADGLITIASKGKVYNPADRKQFFNALEITLTDKGRKFMTGKPVTADTGGSPTVYENAIFCGKEVADITDVTTNEDSANVDYSWRAAKLTPFGDDFHKADPNEKATCNPAVSVTASAALERHNDVWKVTVAQ